jgi:hypothetical protein
MPKLNSLIDSFLQATGSDGKKASLRYAAGLCGVSYETLRGWQDNHEPELKFILERKGHVAETYNFLEALSKQLTPEAVDLVVAGADTK